MYCTICIIAPYFGKLLDVLDVSSSERKVCRVLSKSAVAVGIFLACTARSLSTILGSRWPGAHTVSRVWKTGTVWLLRKRKKQAPNWEGEPWW